MNQYITWHTRLNKLEKATVLLLVGAMLLRMRGLSLLLCLQVERRLDLRRRTELGGRMKHDVERLAGEQLALGARVTHVDEKLQPQRRLVSAHSLHLLHTATWRS